MLNVRNRHFFLLDTLTFSLTPLLALLLRLDTMVIPPPFVPALLVYTIVGLLMRLAIFYALGLYRRYWLFASIDEVIHISLAMLTAASLMTLLFTLTRTFDYFVFPHTVLVIDGLLALIVVGGLRFAIRVSANQLGDVLLEDLLRRQPVQTDMAAVQRLISGRRILVTGGGGSIGSELCRQLLRCRPAELIILGHGENSIFEIYDELSRIEICRPLLTPVIADTRFPERIHAVLEQYRPQIIFHAAAHKHVPLMELNPAEAVTNNVLGTRNLLYAALATYVEHFVMISTDKAVNPTNIMGASKRAAELLVQRAAVDSGRPYVAVRFGNVLGSRGSVVLTFKKQIAAGGPVTVTDPDVRRYFMTIQEAVQLVLQAAVLGRGGELFVLDMGEPIKIVDLARDLIQHAGLEVGRDVEIQFTGMRLGDKLVEEMFVPGEIYRRSQHEKILVVDTTCQTGPDELDTGLSMLEAAVQGNDDEAIRLSMQKMVPEFQPGRKGISVLGGIDLCNSRA